VDARRFRALIERSWDAILLVSMEGRALYASPSNTRILGWTNEEFVGRHMPELTHPDDTRRLGERFGALLHVPGGTETVEFRARHRSGSWRQLESTITNLLDDPAVGAVVFNYRDVTERREAERSLRESEERYRAFLAQSSEGIWRAELREPVPTDLPEDEQIARFYAHFEMAECNEAMARMYGYERAGDLLGRPLDDLLVRSDPSNTDYLRAFIRSGYRIHDAESHEVDRDGNPKFFLNNLVGFVEEGALVRVWASQRDITERKQAEEALRISEERYALAARGAADGLWDWNLEEGRIYFSPRWKAMLGYGEGEIADRPEEWLDRVDAEDRARVEQTIARHLDQQTSHVEIEYRIRHKDGSERWMLARGVAVRDASGRAYRMAGSQTDVTERRNAEALLVQRAYYDHLTDLPNRTLFTDRLAQAVARAGRLRDYRFAILFIDLDRFKVINDSLGHLAGDRLIAEIAARLRACPRPGDVLARLGGDEFGILLDVIDSVADAAAVADHVLETLSRSFTIAGNEVFTSASIGIAVSSEHHRTPDELLREADIAMYRAKATGKGRYVVYDSTLHEYVTRLMRFETDLRRAIERDELFVDYQPIVRLESGGICGLEALVRWRHPSLGVVPPNDFIPVAEETSLILPIDRTVLHEACRQLRVWKERFDLPDDFRVSVNFSARQITQLDLAESVREALAATGLEARHLEIEITENALIENAEVAEKVLGDLKALGVRLLVDDFGTGYSSLGYLHRFPFDTIKIDRSFVSRIERHGGKNAEIVRAIAALAEGLGMSVVAEGVETHEQAERVIAFGCTYGQGHLYSRPISAAETERLLAGGLSRSPE
jgi:diguanylate cyclase (GGDEF)-like protein/PAS domain S-box-containing protein